MLIMLKQNILFFILFLCTLQVQAQVNPAIQAQAKAELQRRGVDEAAVRAKLSERGIDIDNVSTEQLPTLQSTIEAVIKEVEAEKAGNNTNASNPTNVTDAPPSVAPPESTKIGRAHV